MEFSDQTCQIAISTENMVSEISYIKRSGADTNRQNLIPMLVTLLCVLGAATVFVRSNNEALVGKGQWIVEGISECPDPEKYEYGLDVKRRKINRTHDGFSATLNTPKEINKHSHGAYIEFCKKVDGGCRLQYAMNEPSVCEFAKKYAEDNFYAALANAGLEPPDCPVPEGEIVMTDYVFNYMELPEEAIFGEFTATAFLTEGIERVACVLIDYEFRERDDNDE